MRAYKRLALSSLGGTCINVYLFLRYRGEKEILWQPDAKTLAPTNVLSLLTEVGWATGVLYEYVNHEHLNLESAEMTSSFLLSL